MTEYFVNVNAMQELHLPNREEQLKNKEWRLLGCYAMWLSLESTFQRNLAPPSSGCHESVY
jgi:hypothetical protein